MGLAMIARLQICTASLDAGYLASSELRIIEGTLPLRAALWRRFRYTAPKLNLKPFELGLPCSARNILNIERAPLLVYAGMLLLAYLIHRPIQRAMRRIPVCPDLHTRLRQQIRP